MCIHTNTNTIYISDDTNLDPFDSSWRYYFLDSLVSLCLYLIDKFEDHLDTRQVVRSVSHFVYEFVEFVIVLGHGQNPILSSSFMDMDRVLFFRTRHFTNMMSQ
jgi:hypothetical protein